MDKPKEVSSTYEKRIDYYKKYYKLKKKKIKHMIRVVKPIVITFDQSKYIVCVFF